MLSVEQEKSNRLRRMYVNDIFFIIRNLDDTKITDAVVLLLTLFGKSIGHGKTKILCSLGGERTGCV